jgi:hypothetical protein
MWDKIQELESKITELQAQNTSLREKVATQPERPI